MLNGYLMPIEDKPGDLCRILFEIYLQRQTDITQRKTQHLMSANRCRFLSGYIKIECILNIGQHRFPVNCQRPVYPIFQHRVRYHLTGGTGSKHQQQYQEFLKRLTMCRIYNFCAYSVTSGYKQVRNILSKP